MAKGSYAVVGGVTKKIKKKYAVIDGKTRKIKKQYVVVDGKTRPFFGGQDAPLLLTRRYGTKVYRSLDNGETWTQSSANGISPVSYAIISKIVRYNGLLIGVLLMPDSVNTANQYVYSSDGYSWTSRQSPGYRNIFGIDIANGKVYLIIDGGYTYKYHGVDVYESVNGLDWTKLYSTFEYSRIDYTNYSLQPIAEGRTAKIIKRPNGSIFGAIVFGEEYEHWDDTVYHQGSVWITNSSYYHVCCFNPGYYRLDIGVDTDSAKNFVAACDTGSKSILYGSVNDSYPFSSYTYVSNALASSGASPFKTMQGVIYAEGRWFIATNTGGTKPAIAYSDNRSTWTHVTVSNDDDGKTSVLFYSEGRLLLSTTKGLVYYSDDLGITWTKSLGITAASGNSGYYITDNHNGCAFCNLRE